MMAANYSTVRNNLKEYCDKVVDDCETLIITRKNEKNVVLLSLDEYNNMMENLHVWGGKTKSERLERAIADIEAGRVVEKTMEELEAMVSNA